MEQNHQILGVLMQPQVNRDVYGGIYKTYLQMKLFGVMKMTQEQEKSKETFGVLPIQL